MGWQHSYANQTDPVLVCDYRKISKTIRTIFTKKQKSGSWGAYNTSKLKTHNFYYIFLIIFFILLQQHGAYQYNNRSALTPEWTE